MSEWLLSVFFLGIRRTPRSTRTDTLFPYTTLFRSQIRAHLVADGAEPLEIDEAWIGRAARDDHPGLVLKRHRLKRVIVYQVAVLVDAILHGVEPFARQRGPCAMRQVPARIQRHAEEGVAGLKQRQHHRAIGLRARMGLHIGEGAVEKLPCAIDRKAFHTRRVGKECVSTCRSRWSPYLSK